MKVTRAEWEKLNTLIDVLNDACDSLAEWRSPTSALAFQKMNMLQGMDTLINNLEELELEMDFGE